MTSWKQHVASSMRGKKFGSRMEANAFMKKLSEEWKKKKGGTVDEFQVTEDSGAGKRRRKPKVMRVESDEEEEIQIPRKHKIGGSTALLLSRGLGDGVHLSVLPK